MCVMPTVRLYGFSLTLYRRGKLVLEITILVCNGASAPIGFSDLAGSIHLERNIRLRYSASSQVCTREARETLKHNIHKTTEEL